MICQCLQRLLCCGVLLSYPLQLRCLRYTQLFQQRVICRRLRLGDFQTAKMLQTPQHFLPLTLQPYEPQVTHSNNSH